MQAGYILIDSRNWIPYACWRWNESTFESTLLRVVQFIYFIGKNGISIFIVYGHVHSLFFYLKFKVKFKLQLHADRLNE